MRGYGSDLLSSRVVPSAETLPSISGAATLRTMIAASENRIATTSALTDAVRYRFDALYIYYSPRDALFHLPKTCAKRLTESWGALVAPKRRSGGDFQPPRWKGPAEWALKDRSQAPRPPQSGWLDREAGVIKARPSLHAQSH